MAGFEKRDILGMPGAVVDEYVCEEVLGWARAAAARLGGASIEETAWVETLGSSAVTRRDGTKTTAPRYGMVAVAGGTPDFADAGEVVQILEAMARAGYELRFTWAEEAFRASYATSPGDHGDATEIALPSAPDALRRAALLAVQ